MGFPRIEIKSKGFGKEGNDSIFTDIFVDGHKLRGVRSFELKKDSANSVPILTLDLNALDLSVDCQMLLRHKGFLKDMEIIFKDNQNEQGVE